MNVDYISGNLAFKIEPREELINGKVVLMAPASTNHNRVGRNLTRIFGEYLDGKPCEVFQDGVGVFLEEGSEEYEPDVAVVCDPDKVRSKGIIGAPDLVIEILSPGTVRDDRGHKKDVYECHGVREYWLVDIGNLNIEQYILKDGKYYLEDVYHWYSAAEILDLKEKERAKVRKDLHCIIFDDLIIPLERVFSRVQL